MKNERVIDQVKKASSTAKTACEIPCPALSTRETSLTNGLGNLLANLVAAAELGEAKTVGHVREVIRQMYLAALRRN